MRHRRHREILGVDTKHRKALVRNLVQSLVIYRQIKTTVTRAKAASVAADKMVTLAKRGDLHARRLLISKLGSEAAVRSLIQDIAPAFKDRNGGYTRILRLPQRKTDGAHMALLEFSTRIEVPASQKPKKSKPKKEKPAAKAEPVKEKIKEIKPKSKEKSTEEAQKTEKNERKESEKKGGFLSRLRKYLKGDDN